MLVNIASVDENGKLAGDVESSDGIGKVSGFLTAAEDGIQQLTLTIYDGGSSSSPLIAIFDPTTQMIFGTDSQDQVEDKQDQGGQQEPKESDGKQDRSEGGTVFTDIVDDYKVRTEGNLSENSEDGTGVKKLTLSLSRTPAEMLRFKFTPSAYRQNPAKARWKFAAKQRCSMFRRNTGPGLI
jgi:hypothetical protein